MFWDYGDSDKPKAATRCVLPLRRMPLESCSVPLPAFVRRGSRLGAKRAGQDRVLPFLICCQSLDSGQCEESPLRWSVLAWCRTAETGKAAAASRLLAHKLGAQPTQGSASSPLTSHLSQAAGPQAPSGPAALAPPSGLLHSPAPAPVHTPCVLSASMQIPHRKHYILATPGFGVEFPTLPGTRNCACSESLFL